MPDSAPPAEAAKKNFFVSYTARDVAWAEWIAFELENAGYTTVIQAWDFAAGGDFVIAMHRAVLECERLLPVFSPAYFQSPFALRELSSFTARDGDTSRRLVIPVLVAPVPDLGFFATLVHIDISTDEEAAARARLLSRIREGRAKPSAQGAFPGVKAGTVAQAARPFPRGPFPPNNFVKAGVTENEGFVGRVDELTRLHAALAREDSAALTQALTGDGGFGKSEIARAYLFRHGREYAGLWWVEASRERHNLSTEQLAHALGFDVPAQVDWAELRRALAAVLSEKKSLLVLDNVDDADTLRDWRVSAPARRLITTRLHGPALGVRAEIAVDVLPPADARALVAQHRVDLRAGKDAALDAIATALGHHALAVALAGAYLGLHVTLAPEGFLEKLRDERSEASREVLDAMTPRDHRGEEYARSVSAALSLHLQELAGTPAESVLEAAAFLHPAGIGLPLLAEILAEAGTAATDVNAAVEALVARSVARYDGGMSLHRLTQRVLRVRLTPEARRALLRAALVVLARRLADAINPMKLKEHAPFIPHAESALEFAEKSDLHAEAGELALNLGNHARLRAEYSSALAANERAEKCFRAAFGNDHDKVAIAANNRGSVLRAKGDLDGALACFQEAERIQRTVFGDNHPKVAIDVNNRGSVLRAKGDLDGALACYREAERIDRAAFGDDHPDVATDVNNRGSVLQDKGDRDGALACYREAFSIFLRKQGPRAGNTVVMAGNLAAVGVDPIALAGEIAGPEVAAELAIHYQADRARQG